MFKATLLAPWYQLFDPALEEALSDRWSFRRFCGFALDDATPAETMLCRFRSDRAEAGAGAKLMVELDRQLGERRLLIKGRSGFGCRARTSGR
jgi:transposase, IS5 family